MVAADEVIVHGGGTLDGNGGTIVGDVTVTGGTVAPGTSPGTLTVDGDVSLLAGLLEIEIAGTAPGQFDVLNVLGDFFANPGFTLRFSFLDSFIPTSFDHFEFLNVGGLFDADFSMANIVFQGLDDPSLFSVAGTGGRFALVGTDSDFGGEQVAPVPLPATAPLLAGLAGLAALRRRRRAA